MDRNYWGDWILTIRISKNKNELKKLEVLKKAQKIVEREILKNEFGINSDSSW